MCLALIGRITALEDGRAVVDVDGRPRAVSTLLVPEVSIGDWVAIGAGWLLRRLEPTEAVDLLDLQRIPPERVEEGSPRTSIVLGGEGLIDG